MDAFRAGRGCGNDGLVDTAVAFVSCAGAGNLAEKGVTGKPAVLSFGAVFRPSLGGEVDRIEVGRARLAACPGSCFTVAEDEILVESFKILDDDVVVMFVVFVVGRDNGAGGIGKLKPLYIALAEPGVGVSKGVPGKEGFSGDAFTP